MSSTIQILALSSNSTFDQPATPDGRQWKTALSYLATCPSWFSIAWGRHLEAREKVTLFIDWKTGSAAQTFLAAHYSHFAVLLAPLLTAPPDLPYVTDLHPSVVEPKDLVGYGGVTTISKLTYSALSTQELRHLLAVSFDFYVQILEYECQDGGFKGGTESLAVDGATGAPTTTLWMMVSWESVEAEERCEFSLLGNDGTNQKEASLGPLLEKADPGGEVYHVSWDVLLPDIMAWWKDSENTKFPYKPLKDG
jgi:hypothetical protein